MLVEEHAAAAVHLCHVQIPRLPRASLILALHDGSEERVRAVSAGLHAGQIAAVHADRELPARRNDAALDGTPALSLLVEAENLRRQDRVDRRAVIQHGEATSVGASPAVAKERGQFSLAAVATQPGADETTLCQSAPVALST